MASGARHVQVLDPFQAPRVTLGKPLSLAGSQFPYL